MIASDSAVRGDGQSVDQEIAKPDISYICSGVNAFAKYVLQIYALQAENSSLLFMSRREISFSKKRAMLNISKVCNKEKVSIVIIGYYIY